MGESLISGQRNKHGQGQAEGGPWFKAEDRTVTLAAKNSLEKLVRPEPGLVLSGGIVT